MQQQPHVLFFNRVSRMSYMSRSQSLANYFHSYSALQFYPTSPLVQKMIKLHISNIKTLQQSKIQAKVIHDEIQTKKTKYFKTLHKRYESAGEKLEGNIKLKSQTISQELHWKNERQKENLQKIYAQEKRKADSFYKHQIYKFEKASDKKLELINSRSKSAKKYRLRQINGNKSTIEENLIIQTEKSKELQEKSSKKLILAKTKRNSFFRELSQTVRKNRQQALSLVMKIAEQKSKLEEQELLEKSLMKIKTKELLINEQSSRIHDKSKKLKQNNNRRLQKVHTNKKLKDKQMQEKLQRLFRQKNQKSKQAENKKLNSLNELSASLMVQRQRIRQNRQKSIEDAGKRVAKMKKDMEIKNSDVLKERMSKWQQVEAIKKEFESAKEKLMYTTLQLTLRR